MVGGAPAKVLKDARNKVVEDSKSKGKAAKGQKPRAAKINPRTDEGQGTVRIAGEMLSKQRGRIKLSQILLAQTPVEIKIRPLKHPKASQIKSRMICN